MAVRTRKSAPVIRRLKAETFCDGRRVGEYDRVSLIAATMQAHGTRAHLSGSGDS